MPYLFDLCNDEVQKQKFTELQKQLKADDLARKEKEWAEAVARHKAKHIFDSYEDALDWLTKHPGSVISWHIKTLSWLPDENLFLSYEQEYSMDGVIPYNVRRKYTREQLLDQIYSFLKEKGETVEVLKDKYGKLEYVHIIKED